MFKLTKNHFKEFKFSNNGLECTFKTFLNVNDPEGLAEFKRKLVFGVSLDNPKKIAAFLPFSDEEEKAGLNQYNEEYFFLEIKSSVSYSKECHCEYDDVFEFGNGFGIGVLSTPEFLEEVKKSFKGLI